MSIETLETRKLEQLSAYTEYVKIVNEEIKAIPVFGEMYFKIGAQRLKTVIKLIKWRLADAERLRFV